jgi:hypothetical protein
MIRLGALKEELRKAAGLAKRLEASADLIWRSRESTIFDFQARFGPISESLPASGKWKPMHPSGVPFIQVLSEFARAADEHANKLRDRGGKNTATAFGDLAIWLDMYLRELKHDKSRTPASDDPGVLDFRFVAAPGVDMLRVSPNADFFKLTASVVDLLRVIEKRLPAANFKLPPNDEALHRRLNRLGLSPRRPRRHPT